MALAGVAGGWLTARATAQSNVRVNNAPLPTTENHSTYAAVAGAVTPCVVPVFSARIVRTPTDRDPFRRSRHGDDKPAIQKEVGLGTGVIVTPDGYILTNFHVVDGAGEIVVFLSGDSKHPVSARVVGLDSPTDIAVLKIEAKHLPAITFGNSADVKVGDVVLAVGNPFALGQTVTMGIISGINRQEPGNDVLDDFLQTDAAINPGNSGGALVDDHGRLVGMNTAIISASGGNQGIGFAVPSNLALKVLKQLVQSGKVQRGYLGLELQDVTPKLAKAFHSRMTEGGALVSAISTGKPAAAAGLKPGDIIMNFNGRPIEDSDALKRMVANTPPGSSVHLQVLRENVSKAMTTRLGDLPAPLLPPTGREPLPPEQKGLSGLSFIDLDSMLRMHFKVPPDVNGAVVLSVDQNSAAYDAGLRPGDVIEEIQHQTIVDSDQASTVAGRIGDGQALVLVWNEDGTHFVVTGGD